MTAKKFKIPKRFKKALVTKEGFVYYCDYKEGDENASTVMTDLEGNLLSNNYFASESLLEEFEENKPYTFMSKEYAKNVKLYRETLNEDDPNKHKKW